MCKTIKEFRPSIYCIDASKWFELECATWSRMYPLITYPSMRASAKSIMTCSPLSLRTPTHLLQMFSGTSLSLADNTTSLYGIKSGWVGS